MITTTYTITRPPLPKADEKQIANALHAVGWRGTLKQLSTSHAEYHRRATLAEMQAIQRQLAATRMQRQLLENAKVMAAQKAEIIKLTELLKAKGAKNV